MSSSPPPALHFPLTPLEKKARNHGLLLSVGFLIFVPLGVLVARYARTFTNKWWFGHWIINFIISSPLIFAGWALGHQATNMSGLGHFNDTHKKVGLTLLVLYCFQLVLGIFIHFIRTPALFIMHRSPQNYFHAILGFAILALAAYNIHYGLYTEWMFVTGNLHPVPMSAKDAWLALMIIFWALYGIGLLLLPRQWKQERGQLQGRREKEDVASSGASAGP
ncbi:hypothetical protein EWM64_g3556 [Hericium alpestre]|uniref:Cytochrome b561 domain-containing protein n=1 Tax=Hericium alpestre TaxID=135208 RepID=A0A4Z0A193_9AGAM|nr:hypothetical protein EWM64_g3556 [Hericium alpestre]